MKRLNQFIVKQNWKRFFGFFLLMWLSVNIVQALLTEIMPDEAYYFLYGENLAWGYFDHPPMVGLMTYLSNLIFNGNMSVRFMTLLVRFFTLFIIWKLIDEKSPTPKKIILFFVTMASMVMFTAYGFITTPDVPFLFFTALFLFFYKEFLKKESWRNTILLSLAMAGMMYSKYHTVLIIGLIILSNFRLLTRYKFWVAGFFALILLMPHLYWQYSMDFPSLKYHLNDRSSNFKWAYFFEYLPNQLVVFNPLTFGAVIYILVKHKAHNTFERGLYFLTVGFLTFFWLMTFKGHVEPHWTVACSIPMIILIYRHSMSDRKLMNFVKKWIAPSIILIFAVRVVLVTNWLPEKTGFNGKKEKCEAIESVAGNLPVVFTGSFQNPSNYHFFTQQESFLLSAVNSRQTQFDIWQKELSYQGKPVFICQKSKGRSQKYNIDGRIFDGYKTDNFQSVNRVKIEYYVDKTEVYPGDTLDIHFNMYNPTKMDIDFYHPEFPVTCKAICAINPLKGKKGKVTFTDCLLDKPIDKLSAQTCLTGNIKTVVPDLPPRDYQFAITLDNTICAAKNSDFITLEIKQK